MIKKVTLKLIVAMLSNITGRKCKIVTKNVKLEWRFKNRMFIEPHSITLIYKTSKKTIINSYIYRKLYAIISKTRHWLSIFLLLRRLYQWWGCFSWCSSAVCTEGSLIVRLISEEETISFRKCERLNEKIINSTAAIATAAIVYALLTNYAHVIQIWYLYTYKSTYTFTHISIQISTYIYVYI